MCYVFVVRLSNARWDWIDEIEKHAGGLGRPPIFNEAMTTLSFRLEESLKQDVNLLAEYLTWRLQSPSSVAAVIRAFIASGLEQMQAQYPDLRKFLEQRRTEKDGEELPVAKGKKAPKAGAKTRNARKRT